MNGGADDVVGSGPDDESDWYDDREAQAAIAGNAEAARAMWKRVAQGGFGPDVQEWLQIVAAKIIRVDEEEKGNRRVDQFVAAIGIAGRRDAHRALRDYISIVEQFSVILPDGSERPSTLDELVEGARRLGLAPRDPDSAKKLVSRIRRETCAEQPDGYEGASTFY